MNKNRLITLLNNYANKFEFLIDPNGNDESYKWRAIQYFQDNFDIDAENFADMFAKATSKTFNLINDSTQPLTGIIEYAKRDNEKVRAIFKELYSDDGGDLTNRQNRIANFISESEELKEKYFPGSWRFTQTPRSVMAYLTLYKPDENFFYKATEAKEFADCVEFYEDWGSGNNFKVAVYHKMCNQMIDVIKKNPEFLKLNNSRFEKDTRKIYADKNLHTLAFDIIYSSMAYDLYSGISYEHPDSKDKKIYLQNVEKAKEIKSKVDKVQNDIDELNQVLEYSLPKIAIGETVTHKMAGSGKIIDFDNRYVTVQLDSNGSTKKYDILLSIASGLIHINDLELENYLKQHINVIKNRDGLARKLENLSKELNSYSAYL